LASSVLLLDRLISSSFPIDLLLRISDSMGAM